MNDLSTISLVILNDQAFQLEHIIVDDIPAVNQRTRICTCPACSNFGRRPKQRTTTKRISHVRSCREINNLKANDLASVTDPSCRFQFTFVVKYNTWKTR